MSSELSPRGRLIMGIIFLIAGCFIIAVATDLIATDPRQFKAPRWVVATAGGVFAIAGLLVLIPQQFVALQKTLGTLIFIAFAAITNWIAFGPGTRQCTGGISGLISSKSSVGELECRIAFGVGAVILDLILLAIVWNLFRRSQSSVKDQE